MWHRAVFFCCAPGHLTPPGNGNLSIGSESEQYRLNVLGKYQGDAEDALRQHTGKKFSTQDRDNDESEQNCAASQSGAFWYGGSCNLRWVFYGILDTI